MYYRDHIGAVPYLLRQRADIPLVGSKLTLALVQEKIREHRIRGTDQREVADSQRMAFGAFDVEFVAVNHSIPDALAVMVRTPAGTILHTGDFKMDQLPLDNRITDLRSFARLGQEGVDLFLVDSTNAEVPGFTTPELNIDPRWIGSLRRAGSGSLWPASPHTSIGCSRSWMLPSRTAARSSTSGVPWSGNMAVARDLGHLRVPGDTLIDLRDIEDHRPQDVVIISTGSQGEPLSALSRMANRDHPVITLRAGDTVGAGQFAYPGQRKLGVSRDQRSQQARRPDRPQRKRPGARVRTCQCRRVALRLQPRTSAQRLTGPR